MIWMDLDTAATLQELQTVMARHTDDLWLWINAEILKCCWKLQATDVLICATIFNIYLLPHILMDGLLSDGQIRCTCWLSI
jgi:hypothetical protein